MVCQKEIWEVSSFRQEQHIAAQWNVVLDAVDISRCHRMACHVEADRNYSGIARRSTSSLRMRDCTLGLLLTHQHIKPWVKSYTWIITVNLQHVHTRGSLSCCPCPQLNAMPLCDLLLQHLVDQLVLLDHRQALELGRLNLDCVHRSASAADVLYLESGSACHSHNMLCTVSDATVAAVFSAM